MQGDYIHVSATNTRTYTTSDDAQWENLDAERHLRTASTTLGPNPGNNPPLVSPFPGALEVPVVNTPGLVVFNCYPNPAYNEVVLQYYVAESSPITINLMDITGKVVYNNKTADQVKGLYLSTVNLAGLPDGAYIVTLTTDKGVYTNKILKGK